MLKITYYPTRNERFPFCCEVSDSLAAAEVIAALRRLDEDLEHRIDQESLFRSLASMAKAKNINFTEFPGFLRVELIKEEPEW